MGTRLVVTPEGRPSQLHLDAIRAVAVGTGYHRIAGKIHVSRRTVARLIDDLKRHTGATGLPELVAEALRRGWLIESVPDPPDPPDTPGTPPARVHVPAMSPVRPTHFIGRTAELDVLDFLGGTASGHRMAVVSGIAGVGKTALVLHWAHRFRDRFPDGQLYVDLRGYSGATPMTPLQALTVLLGGLGLPPARIPVELDAATALFRTITTDLRLLVILDNAAHVAQVRPLLTNGAGCFTAVTARIELTGLIAREGAHAMMLDVLPADVSTHLLGSLLGDPRATAVGDLAEMCGHLPLAIRIAAANLAERRHTTIDGYVRELRSGGRLSMLQVPDDPDSAVRAAFDLTYTTLDMTARRLFHLIGTAPVTELSRPALNAMLGDGAVAVEPPLHTLLRHHLVEERSPGRYAMHDLLREYARERAAETTTGADLAHSIDALLRHYLDSARAAADATYPYVTRLDPPAPPGRTDHTDAGAAMAWLETERINLVSIIAEPPPTAPHYAWLLADQLRGYFALRRYDDDWLRTGRAAWAAAQSSADDTGTAAALLTLGWACRSTGRYPEAMRHLSAAYDASVRCGWLQGQAILLGYLGVLRSDTGDPEEGLRLVRRALDVDPDLPPGVEAFLRNNCAVMHLHLGELAMAATEFGHSLDLLRRAGSLDGQGMALTNRGFCRSLLGDYVAARADLAHGAWTSRRTGDRVSESLAVTTLADVGLRRGDIRAANRLATAAVGLARAVGDGFCQTYALTIRAEVRRCAGDTDAAATDGHEALDIARRTANLEFEIEAQIALGRAADTAGQSDTAIEYLSKALQLAQGSGYRVCEGRALTALAQASAHHDPVRAADLGRRAVGLHASTGYCCGEFERTAPRSEPMSGKSPLRYPPLLA